MSTNLPIWLKANAWREIFARIFENMETQTNIYPEWLVNPTTNRRLKLDIFYPEIGIAMRLEGVVQSGKKRRRTRLSLEEEEQKSIRDEARVEVCRTHGIELIVVNLVNARLRDIFRTIDLQLSRAKSRTTTEEKLNQISRARTEAVRIARRLRSEDDLKLFAELWEDRQYRIPEASETSIAEEESEPAIQFSEGMEVEHITFGEGLILSTEDSGDDTLLTVQFESAGQKTLAASLVRDKLYPRQS